MFDTLRTPMPNHLGFSLAQCGNHKSRLEQSKADYYSLEGQIPQLEKELSDLTNGQLQNNYKINEEKQESLRLAIAELNAKIHQARLLRDAWRDNPSQQAQLEGLGWGWFKRNFVKPLNNLVSCDQYENERAEWDRKKNPLTGRVSALRREVDIWKEKLSPENMALLQKSISGLELQKQNLEGQFNDLNREITETRTAYTARKELEAMEEKKKAESLLKKKQNDKVMMGVGVVTLAVIMGMVFMPKPNKKVNM